MSVTAPTRRSRIRGSRARVHRLSPYRVPTIWMGDACGPWAQRPDGSVLLVTDRSGIRAVHISRWFSWSAALAQRPTGDMPIHAPIQRRIDIRRRMVLVFAAVFIVLMGVATLEGFWPGAGPGAGDRDRRCSSRAWSWRPSSWRPVPAAAARHRPARPRERAAARAVWPCSPGRAARRPDRARQPPRLPGGARPPARACRTTESAARAAAGRRRRPQARQRRARPCQRATDCSWRSGRSLASSLRRNDRAFRVGGDEFAILLPVPTSRRPRPSRAVSSPARSMAATRRHPVDAVLAVDRRVGVPGAEQPRAACSTATPTRPCTGASATAGRTRRPTTRVGTASRPTTLDRGPAAVIGTILAERLLRPVYQPIFSLATGEPVGYEGLIRPDRGAPIRRRERAVRRRRDGPIGRSSSISPAWRSSPKASASSSRTST